MRDRAVVAVFVALLLAPLALALTGHAGFDEQFIGQTELRRPFVAPAVSTGALATGGWARDAEREIGDGFPLRTPIIEAYQRFKYSGLHDVASPNVMRGRNGWFFLANEEKRYLSDPQQTTDAALAHAADVYAQHAAWCAAHGARFALLIAPNKSTIYANELPDGMRYPQPAPADRFIALARARGLRVVDVRAALEAAAAHAGVYSKGDTHWNDGGAAVAYKPVLQAAGVRDALASRAMTASAATGEGDLLRLAGISGEVSNTVVTLSFARRAHAVDPLPGPAGFAVSATVVDDPSLPSGILFGDSFTGGIAPFLAESFRRLDVVRFESATGPQFDRALVVRLHPDVVIQEIVERSLVFAGDFQP